MAGQNLGMFTHEYCGSSNSALESDISYRHYSEVENCGKIVPQKDWHNDH